MTDQVELDELYQELILDHHKRPRCRGAIISPDSKETLFNPLCGDQVAVSLKLKDGLVQQIAIEGQGCAISQASASMMAELCSGKSKEQASQAISDFTKMMRKEISEEAKKELGDCVALEGVSNYAARIKCAMLGWEALQKCLLKTSGDE